MLIRAARRIDGADLRGFARIAIANVAERDIMAINGHVVADRGGVFVDAAETRGFLLGFVRGDLRRGQKVGASDENRTNRANRAQDAADFEVFL